MSFYLNDILIWEDSSFLLSLDIFFYFFYFLSNFINNYFSLFLYTHHSFIDFITLKLIDHESVLLLNYLFFTDLYFFLSTIYLKFFLLNSNFDFLFILFTLNTEIIFIYYSFLTYIQFFNINSNVLILYDVFSLNLFFSYFNFYIYLKWLIIFLFNIFLFFHIIHFNKVGLFIYLFLFRIYFFLVSLAFENRIQFDLLYLTGILILFVWIIVLLSYDDIFTEIIELNHLFFIYYFLFIIFYLLYRYSLHYFAFLENSVSDGFTNLFILKQFVRDISNTFALFLRFFLLLFRLNIYDGLDDFLDSYYIFFIDFDEDSYFDELFFYNNFWFFFTDNHEDLVFYQLTEFEWFDDLFSKYFVLWGKIFMFWGFILEEIFRISLAFYIFYLIIFEVHAVNNSYSETTIFSKLNIKL